MTPQEFQIQINRLVDTYGQQNYRQERINLLWRNVRDFTGTWFQDVVDGMIASHRQAPLPHDFSEFIGRERERRAKHAKTTESSTYGTYSYECKFCRDNGVYVCRKIGCDGLWAFRCHCEKGIRDGRKQIPQYTTTHEVEGFCYVDILSAKKAMGA